MSFTIEQLSIDCCVTAELASEPQRAQQVLAHVLETASAELPRYVKRAFANELESEDIVHIDTLHFDATVHMQWSSEDIARALALQIARSVWVRLADPQTPRFRDRAELIARFLLECARGSAFTQPWHRAFDGWKVLSTSALVRSIAVAEPAPARAALARLGRADLRQVLRLLNAADSQRVIDACVGVSGPEAVGVRAIATTLIDLGSRSLQTPLERLELLVALEREYGVAASALTLDLAQVLLGLAAQVQAEEMTPDLWELLLDRAVAAAGLSHQTQVRAVLMQQEAECMEAVMQLAPVAAADHRWQRTSGCGGVWLLLPALLDALPEEPIDAVTSFAFCALCLAAGHNAYSVWHDSALRDALNIAPDDARVMSLVEDVRPVLSADVSIAPRSFAQRRVDLRYLHAAVRGFEVPRQCRRALVRATYRALRLYANRLPGFAAASLAHLWTNFLHVPAILEGSANSIDVALAPPPLDVIWRISGADRARMRLPDGRTVAIQVRR